MCTIGQSKRPLHRSNSFNTSFVYSSQPGDTSRGRPTFGGANLTLDPTVLRVDCASLVPAETSRVWPATNGAATNGVPKPQTLFAHRPRTSWSRCDEAAALE